MLDKIRQTVEGKRVLILGFGREGRSSLRLVSRAGGWTALAVADQAQVDPGREGGSAEVELITGSHYMDKEVLDSFDIVFKTPGIVLPMEPERYACRFVSQTGLFHRAVPGSDRGDHGDEGKRAPRPPFSITS